METKACNILTVYFILIIIITKQYAVIACYLFLFGWVVWVGTDGVTQGLLLTLHAEVTPCKLGGPDGMPGVEPR